MKPLYLIFFLLLPIPCFGATANQLHLAGRFLYRETTPDLNSYFKKDRESVSQSGFKFAYFHDINTGKNYTYFIDEDKIEETLLGIEEFSKKQGFESETNSIGPRFLIIKFSTYNGTTKLDIGISTCHGYTAEIVTDAKTEVAKIRGLSVKCCF